MPPEVGTSGIQGEEAVTIGEVGPIDYGIAIAREEVATQGVVVSDGVVADHEIIIVQGASIVVPEKEGNNNGSAEILILQPNLTSNDWRLLVVQGATAVAHNALVDEVVDEVGDGESLSGAETTPQQELYMVLCGEQQERNVLGTPSHVANSISVYMEALHYHPVSV